MDECIIPLKQNIIIIIIMMFDSGRNINNNNNRICDSVIKLTNLKRISLFQFLPCLCRNVNPIVLFSVISLLLKII